MLRLHLSRLMASSTFSTLTTTVGMQALGIVSGVLLARTLGATGRGELATVILWPTVIAYVGDLGGPNAYVYQSASKEFRLSDIVGNILPIALVQTILLYIAGIPLILLLTANTPEIRWVTLSFLLFYIPINLLTRYCNSVNQGLGNYRIFNWVRLSVQGVNVLGVLLLWILDSASVETIIVATILANLLALFISSLSLVKAYEGVWKPQRGIIKKTFSYGIRTHLGSLNALETLRLDLAVIALFLGPYEVGLYTIASALANLPRSVSGSLGMVAMPAVAKAEDQQGQRVVTYRFMKLNLVLTGAITILLVVCSPWLIRFVYGLEFTESIAATQILLIGVIAGASRNLLAGCLRGAGFPLVGSIVEIVNWILLPIGLLLLVPIWRLAGVAAAVSISCAVTALIALWAGKKLLSLEVGRLLPNVKDLRDVASRANMIFQRT